MNCSFFEYMRVLFNILDEDVLRTLGIRSWLINSILKNFQGCHPSNSLGQDSLLYKEFFIPGPYNGFPLLTPVCVPLSTTNAPFTSTN